MSNYARWKDVFHYGFGYTVCPYCGDETDGYTMDIIKGATGAARTFAIQTGKGTQYRITSVLIAEQRWMARERSEQDGSIL